MNWVFTDRKHFNTTHQNYRCDKTTKFSNFSMFPSEKMNESLFILRVHVVNATVTKIGSLALKE